MLADCLNTIGSIFITTFLVAYFFKTAGQNVFAIASYFIIYYAFVLFLALLSGKYIKKGYKLFLYRIGIVLNFIALLTVMCLKERVVDYLFVSAGLLGAAQALKAFTWNLLVSENISRQKMISFRGFLNTIKGGVKIMVPVILGYFLTVDSIVRTITFLLILMGVELVLTQKFQPVKPKKAIRFSLFRFLKKTRKNTKQY